MAKLLVAILVIGLILVGFVGCVVKINKAVGVGAWGPEVVHECTVTRLYVDYSGSGDEKKSHYMVGTTDGVFEVDNGYLLKVWNADELYAKLQQGYKYRITTKGVKRVNWAMQEYPYVIAVEPIK